MLFFCLWEFSDVFLSCSSFLTEEHYILDFLVAPKTKGQTTFFILARSHNNRMFETKPHSLEQEALCYFYFGHRTHSYVQLNSEVCNPGHFPIECYSKQVVQDLVLYDAKSRFRT